MFRTPFLCLLLLACCHAPTQGVEGDSRTPPPAETPIDEAGLTAFGGRWHEPVGLVELDKKLARSGGKCLHLLGSVTFTPAKEIAPGSKLEFWAERWTARAPFTFSVEARVGGTWTEIRNGAAGTKVGRGFPSPFSIPVPQGATSFRFHCTAPEGTGILIDDLVLVPSKPMKVLGVSFQHQVIPILIGRTDNPLIQFTIRTEGDLAPVSLTGVKFHTEGTDGRDLRLRCAGKAIGEIRDGGFTGKHALAAGDNHFQITGGIAADVALNTRIGSFVRGIEIDGRDHESRFESFNRVGLALRQQGQDDCHTYRIPGLATTKAGTLVAVYDNRYRGGGDLPGDIDVGMSRSTDGGQTWEKMKVILDMGSDPAWKYDGVGDPAILVDANTGTLWVAATWSHGNRSWNGSGPGMTIGETGQLMLVRSDDDGLTWSAPINITAQIKEPEWRFVLQGPGNGITLTDGSLAFPAQYRARDGMPFSTLLFSRDRGKTWRIGSGVKPDTTEAQIAQLGDGSVMINCRDNRGGTRSVYTTGDLGGSWKEHPSSRKSLPDPVCNAGLLRLTHREHGPLLIFSNPNTTRGRSHLTLKVSRDEGLTWPEEYHTLYDARGGNGYSTLTRIDEDHIGVLYEGAGELYFLRFPIADLLE